MKRTNQKASKVMKLAHSIKHQFKTFSESLKRAWFIVKNEDKGMETRDEFVEKVWSFEELQECFKEQGISLENDKNWGNVDNDNVSFDESAETTYKDMELRKDEIKRGGRIFTIKVLSSDEFDFKFGDEVCGLEEVEIYRKNQKELFDEAGFINFDDDEEKVILEGNYNNYIYVVDKKDLKLFKPFSIFDVLAVFDDETYNPGRNWTDDEMDILL